MTLLIILGLVTIAGAAAFTIFVRVERGQDASLRTWAAANGWRLDEEGDQQSWRRRLVDRGFEVRQVFDGRLPGGLPVSVADCAYNSDGANPRGGRRATVLVARLPGQWPTVSVTSNRTPWPLFSIMRPPPGGPVAIGHADFDRRFRVLTPHPGYVVPLFTPALIDAHFSGWMADWSLENGELLIAFDWRLKSENFGRSVDRLAWTTSLVTGPAPGAPAGGGVRP